MKDRVPGAPGQYQAVLSAEDFTKLQRNEPFTITLTRDDQPIVEGTPYSKASVLPDEVATKICPNIEDPSPADAFEALATNKQNIATYHYDGAPVVADVAAWLDTVLAVMPNHSAVTVSGDFFNGSHVAYGILYKNNNDWASLYTTSYTDDEWRMRKYEGVWIDPECINRTTQEKLDSLKTVFWATYGKTTGVEIYNAYAAGKLVMCNRGEVNYILSLCNENEWEGEITGAECWFIPINVPVWTNSYGNLGVLYLGLSDNWQTVSSGGILDYIVAQGTSTLYIYPPSLNEVTGTDTPVLFTWNYRKWASGIAECWGESADICFPVLNMGNCLYLEDCGSCAFPFTFADIPAVSCSFVTTGQNGALGFAENVSTTGVGRIHLASDFTGFTGKTTLHAIGRWK